MRGGRGDLSNVQTLAGGRASAVWKLVTPEIPHCSTTEVEFALLRAPARRRYGTVLGRRRILPPSLGTGWMGHVERTPFRHRILSG